MFFSDCGENWRKIYFFRAIFFLTEKNRKKNQRLRVEALKTEIFEMEEWGAMWLWKGSILWVCGKLKKWKAVGRYGR